MWQGCPVLQLMTLDPTDKEDPVPVPNHWFYQAEPLRFFESRCFLPANVFQANSSLGPRNNGFHRKITPSACGSGVPCCSWWDRIRPMRRIRCVSETMVFSNRTIAFRWKWLFYLVRLQFFHRKYSFLLIRRMVSIEHKIWRIWHRGPVLPLITPNHLSKRFLSTKSKCFIQ